MTRLFGVLRRRWIAEWVIAIARSPVSFRDRNKRSSREPIGAASLLLVPGNAMLIGVR
jgi:hypothetical protein